MKKRWLLLGVIIVTGIWAWSQQANGMMGGFGPDALEGKLIVLDPGHGGVDGGASHGEVIESTITLQLVQEVKRQLEKRGASVILTRSTEADAIEEAQPDGEYPTVRARKRADLLYREEKMNEAKADAILSVHVNAVPQSKWRGAQVFFHEEGTVNGQPLAKAIQQSLRETLQNTEREAMGIRQIYLLKKANAPAVLVETGFISNDEERQLLQQKDYQQQIAQGIVEGLEQFFQSQAQPSPTQQGYAILVDD